MIGVAAFWKRALLDDGESMDVSWVQLCQEKVCTNPKRLRSMVESALLQSLFPSLDSLFSGAAGPSAKTASALVVPSLAKARENLVYFPVQDPAQ